MTGLKLFVWEDFCPYYTSGLAFAVAENETEARKQVLASRNGRDVNDWGDLEILPLNELVARSVSGGG